MTVSGKLQQWQRVTVDFTGPNVSETASTFTNYRLDVTFRNSDTGQVIKVPGFFAADGNAANTGASSGNVWRAYFNPPDDGNWTYTASFRTGANIAASTDPNAGTATSFNGATGSFAVAPHATTGGEFRTEGMLVQQPGEHYMIHEGTGDVWIKGGSDSPENFLGYNGFDNTFDYTGGAIKDWSAHVQDWNTGDPTWAGGKGKGIIGAINYLSEHGINSQYLITMNVNGDGKDVWPWTEPKGDMLTYDVSKLDQWEIVFEHMDNKDVAIQMLTQETENDQLLGGLSVQREIYYRELIARFGHHNGLVWNIGEENTNTDAERKAFMDYIAKLDPYGHLTVVHTYPSDTNTVYTPLLGYESMDGVSLQYTTNVRDEVAKWVQKSEAAGDPWVVNWDETGPASTGVMVDNATGAAANHDLIRKNDWGVLMAGAGGIEQYFGGGAQGDTENQDFRLREDVWRWTSAASHFFEQLPVQNMKQFDAATSSTGDYVFAQEGKVYAIYLPTGGTTSLDLTKFSGDFTVDWYNPRTGGALLHGSVTTVHGGGIVGLGNAPADAGKDWAVLVRSTSVGDSWDSSTPTAPSPSPTPTTDPTSGTTGTTITGTSANDLLYGTAASESIYGMAGNDKIDGKGGVDHLYGGIGNDVYFSNGSTIIAENAGEGIDVVNCGYSYTLGANVENLVLRSSANIDGTGNDLANTITGNSGINTLEGMGGNDILIGSTGADNLWGGLGYDTFRYCSTKEMAGDKIFDFEKGDHIDLKGIDANAASSTNDAFHFVSTPTGAAGEVWAAEKDGDTNLYVDTNGGGADAFITLAGTGHNLVAADVVL